MRYWRSLIFGCTSFVLQLTIILLLCPEKNLTESWLSLASHWDSEWYEAIAAYGYINIDGPMHTGLTQANVVFFPGYPYLSRLLVYFFHVNAKVALLIVSQLAALGFWCLFFYILRTNRYWQQWCAAFLIMIFPTSWFFYVGYSESLFMFFCCLMLWLSTQKKWILAGISGLFMTATRIIGLPILAAPLFSILVINFSSIQSYAINTRLGRRIFMQKSFPAIKTLAIGSLGCIGFLLYCAIHFGSWHLYFDMERIGWQGTADPWFFLSLPTWLPPPLGYHLDLAPTLPEPYGNWFGFRCYQLAAYTFSEMLVPIFLWICLLYTYCIFKKTRTRELESLTWYFAAMLAFLFNCFSLATRHYESMSRCLDAVWILLIMCDVLHPQKVLLFRLKPGALFFSVLGICLICGGFWIQMLLRFYLGWWVA